jgi:hypothetical protein
MGLTEKAKELADVALEKAGVYSEKAAVKAAELSEVAREKAPGYLDRAADVAGRAVDTAAAKVDKATGGRYHEKIEGVTAKVGESLDRRPGTPAPGTTAPGTTAPGAGAHEPPGPVIVPPAPEDVAGQTGGPITPAATNPEAADTDTRGREATGPGTVPGPTG